MRTRSCIRPRTASLAGAETAAVAPIAAAIETTGPTWTKSATIAIAAALAVTATAWLLRGRWTVELNLGGHRLSTVLRKLVRKPLAFTERLQAHFC